MRNSIDVMENGYVKNGYDYDVQCWVLDGKVQRCGHPDSMNCTCNGRRFQGMKIKVARLYLRLGN